MRWTKAGQKRFSDHLLSWKSLVKNFSTLLQNLAERFSLAVAIMIWTSSPLYEGEKLRQLWKRQAIPFVHLHLHLPSRLRSAIVCVIAAQQPVSETAFDKE